VPDILWFFALMWGMSFFGVGAWWAWYALVRYSQRERYARELQLAARRGLPAPDPPQPPNILHFMVKVIGAGALLGIVGAGVALLVAASGNCSPR
jgi:hypothetical protein